MRIVWLRTAIMDLSDIKDYIIKENPRAAKKVVNTIKAAVLGLAENPYIGRKGRVEGTRELVTSYSAYIVPYKVYDDRIVILRVMHTARKWPKNFNL